MKRDVEEHTANIVSGKMRELGRLITTTEKNRMGLLRYVNLYAHVILILHFHASKN